MKKYILPVIAVAFLAVAAIVLIAVPKTGAEDGAAPAEETAAAQEETDIQEADTQEADTQEAVSQEADSQEGDVVIRTADLSEDEISFVRVSGDSKVELIAIKGADGAPKVALGTCQSCNGAPGAYYTQSDDMLQCNNCGLTFPLSVIGEDGTGCHPIMLDASLVTETADGLKISREGLLELEALFEGVEDH